VGEEADNSKMQEAKTAAAKQHKGGASPGSKNPFHIPAQDVNHAANGHNSLNVQDILNLRHNRTTSKQSAVLEHWNRNHPGEPLPDRYNFSLTHDRLGDWGNSDVYHGGGSKQNPFWNKKKKHGNKLPTKTNEDADEEEPLEDGGHHEMDTHGDEIIHDAIKKPVEVVAGDKKPARTPSNVFGGGSAAVPHQQPAAPADTTPAVPADTADTTPKVPADTDNTETPPVEESSSRECSS
jgi:hypothetical protein